MKRAVPIALVSLGGLGLFAWPFLGSNLPASTPAWALTMACLAGLFLIEAGTRQLDARGIALLAAIAAIDTALRLAVIEGIGGFSPIYFLVLCAGYALGPSYGFLAGALSILVSALAGGGVGSLWRRWMRPKRALVTNPRRCARAFRTMNAVSRVPTMNRSPSSKTDIQVQEIGRAHV